MTMPRSFRRSCLALGLAPFLVLGACDDDGGGGGTGDSAGDSGGDVDITDEIFTERSADCADYDADYFANVRDLGRDMDFTGSVVIVADGNVCEISSNSIPNHDFNDAGAFATPAAEVAQAFELPRNPQLASSSTAIGLMSYDAIMLNGVVLDLLAAGCYGVGDGKIGCFDLDTPWRYDPMSPLADFGTDSHNAHTQPDGGYHYHGNPMAMFDDSPGADGSPVIGFAADAFPIYGSYFNDGGNVRKAVSGYTLKSGTRPDGPGGSYDGTYIDDWEFTDAGDLDECNGMTVDGQYGYYVTDTYPWVLQCFSGTPDASFNKGMP